MFDDFVTIKNALVARLSSLVNWTINILSLGVYSRLIDVEAYGLEKVNFLLEHRYKNQFLETADDLDAVVVKAWENDYLAHRKIGATGRLLCTADPGFSVALATYTGPTTQIPRWTIFTDDAQQSSVYSTSVVTYFNGTVVGFRTLTPLDVPVNLGSSLVGFNVTAHGFPVGQLVTITGTASFDGDYLVHGDTTTNQIVIEFPGTFLLETFDGTEKIFTGHIYIPVAEGVPQSFVYTANGDINEKITIFDDSADEYQVEISVIDSNDNFLYPVYVTKDIFLINSTTNYNCSIQSLPSFKGFIETFGDGVTSRKLNAGERILTKFATTKGSKGNILATNVITKSKAPIVDVSGNTASIYFTNLDPISDGKDYEDIESIRHNARALYGAGYRAHADDDWTAILDNEPNVAKSIVWTNADLNNFTVGFTNSIVYISAVSTLGTSLTQSQQDSIVLDLKPDKMSLTDIPQFQPLKVICAQFRVSATVNPVPTAPIIKNIYNALVGKYGILNTNFNTNIYESQAWTIIQQCDTNILYHDTEIWHVERSEDYPQINDSLPAHTVEASLPSVVQPDPEQQIYLVNKNVELWIRRKINNNWQSPKRIGRCDNTTSTLFIGDNGYTILGGNVNYSLNQITYNVLDIINDTPFDGGVTFGVQNPAETDTEGYVLRLVYRTRNGNGKLINDIRLPYFYNITNVELEDVEFYTTFTFPGK